MKGSNRVPERSLIGMRFGRLTVIDFDHTDKYGAYHWLCRCDCDENSLVSVRQWNLTSGDTRSCGCYQKEKARESSIKHGRSSHPLHHTWRGMHQRCTNNHNRHWDRYGGRGISVCDEWDNFENFYNWSIKNGYKHGLTLDRKDNNGDYCPENCRWADQFTQANNRSTTRRIEYAGETYSIMEWSKIFGIKYTTLYMRIRAGNMSDFEQYALNKENRHL